MEKKIDSKLENGAEVKLENGIEDEVEDEINKEIGKKIAPKLSNHTTKIFFKAVGIVLGSIIAIVIVILMMGNNLFKAIQVDTEYVEYSPKNHGKEEKEEKGKKPKVTDKTIMIFGVDKGEGRTDTILIAHLDSQKEKVDVISIPRDTRVFWTEEQCEKAEELGKLYEYESKITEMSSLGGIENLRYFTIRTVEEMLDVKVDSYVVVNTEVIRQLVDALGGIEVDVPRRMEYDDNYQDLHIDLQPGLQVLNGEQAEGLLRWRHNKDFSEQYAMGDLGRIKTQQLFIEAFADKVINDLSVSKLIEVATAVYSNVQTDIKFQQILDYVKYLPYLKVDNIEFATLPGSSADIGGISYYIADETLLPSFVDEHFYGIESDESELLFSETVTRTDTTTSSAMGIE